MRLNNKIHHRWILLVGGAIFPLGLAPFNIWPAVMVSMAILFQTLMHASVKQAFFNSLIYGFGLFIAGASWLYVSIHEYGFISAPLAILATALFCLFLASIFATPFVISALLPQKPLCWMLGLPAIWVISEWVRTWMLTGFPWLYAGYSHTSTWLNGWAPIGGVLLLSFISALGAMLLVSIVNGRIKSRSTQSLMATIAILVVSGYFFQNVEWTENTGKPLTVTLIQPNISQNEKWSPGKQKLILKQLASQTEAHWGSDIIVWPEAAVPTLPQRIPNFMSQMTDRANDSGSTLLTGIITYDINQEKYHSSVLAIGKNSGQYNKTRLVPFGEYVPLESVLRGLIKFFDLPMSSLAIGDSDQPLFSIKEQLIATAICYEVVYPDLVARNSREASLILTVSNDTWFGNSIGPLQHMQMVQMRALENEKPIIRGTNNGISGLVDHKGHISRRLEQHNIGELNGVVQARGGRTPFSTSGSWPIVLFSLLLCVWLSVKGTKTNVLEDPRHDNK